MKKISLTIAGALIALGSVWAGCYFVHVCPTWAEFPTALTALAGLWLGVFTMSAAFEVKK